MKNYYFFLLVGIFLFPTFLSAQFSISGQVMRHNGDPVSDIEVNCDGTVVTDVDGNFEFTNVPLNFMCDVFAVGDFDVLEEVTVLDAILIYEYLTDGNSSINNYQFYALDANHTYSITALDIVKVIELALRKESNIPNHWICFDANYTLGNPPDIPPTTISVEVTDTVTGVDFIAVKRGDPAISSDYMPAPPSAPSPIFMISNSAFQVGDDVQFEVTVEDFDDILGFQHTFKWDPDVLEFQSADGISDYSNFEVNEEQIAQGLLPTVSMINNVQLQDGDAVMTLNFKALADVSSPIEVLSFTDEVTARQIIWENPANNDLFIIDATYINGEGTTGITNAPKKLESFQIFPNPVEDNLNVKALLQSAEDFEISIVNVLGQQVYGENFSQKELLLNIDFSEFPAGTYFLSLKTADGIQTESFVKK